MVGCASTTNKDFSRSQGVESKATSRKNGCLLADGSLLGARRAFAAIREASGDGKAPRHFSGCLLRRRAGRLMRLQPEISFFAECPADSLDALGVDVLGLPSAIDLDVSVDIEVDDSTNAIHVSSVQCVTSADVAGGTGDWEYWGGRLKAADDNSWWRGTERQLGSWFGDVVGRRGRRTVRAARCGSVRIAVDDIVGGIIGFARRAIDCCCTINHGTRVTIDNWIVASRQNRHHTNQYFHVAQTSRLAVV